VPSAAALTISTSLYACRTFAIFGSNSWSRRSTLVATLVRTNFTLCKKSGVAGNGSTRYAALMAEILVVGQFEIFATRVDFGSTFERSSTISLTLHA
jgi:hypothetical protein